MKIVLAPDGFKGSLRAKEVCDSMREGALRAAPEAEIVCVPMADGGEGTVRSLVDALGGSFVFCETEDPIGRRMVSAYAILSASENNRGARGMTAIIEMSAASGIQLLKEREYAPLRASTRGTGLLIKDALDRACRNFIIGIGGSATNDGGAGMAKALGYALLDAHGNEIPEGGGGLRRLDRIVSRRSDARLSESRFTVACDVNNPLLGPNGASRVFGPQKGATPEMIETLESGLENFADKCARDLGKELRDIPGGGAAGGLGAGSVAFLNAELRRGTEIVVDAVGLREKIKGAAFVLTGEGRADAQTASGKTACGVAGVAKEFGIPVILLAGSLGPGAERLNAYGIDECFAVMDGTVTFEDAMKNAAPLIAARTEKIVRDRLSRRTGLAPAQKREK
ncbi:MAG: glycerate kinase [Clostridiales Family XIII bacterium]|jgi:glycerate kinase|nr:glycerate kinase [Clostridiales Family XIII bacterium]